MVDVDVNFELENEEPINANFEAQPDAVFNVDIKTETGTLDHEKLRNRDFPNQHPISAITGLENVLGQLSDDIIAENTRAVNAEEALSDRITNIEEHSITEIVGGSNINVSRDGSSVTVSTQTFTFEQGIASDTWVINHNLNKHPSIQLVDSSGRIFEADREYTSNNQVIVHLQSATSGFAYLN